MAAEAEEEVRLEVEAVAAVYGDDCRVVRDFPPHLVVHVRPRTADDSSQQFVELFLGIKASSQYPKEPPNIYAVESKGLDEHRQTYLITSIHNKAEELSNYPMLVTLCEEAGEILSNMNHPAGDCPLCLYPLVLEDKDGPLPFMKLMSCYHCFHSDCIMQWWEWLQHHDGGTNLKKDTAAVSTGDDLYNVNQHKGFCPVCRKVFDEKDIEHVHDLLDTNTSRLASLAIVSGDDEKEVLHSETENRRREKFAALFNQQQERDGLIEPKKDLAIQPGMYISLPPTTPTTAAGDSIDSCEDATSTSETKPQSQTNNTRTTKHNNSGHRRRNRAHRHPHPHAHTQAEAHCQPHLHPHAQAEAHTQPHPHASRRQPPHHPHGHGQPARSQWQRKGTDTSQQ